MSTTDPVALVLLRDPHRAKSRLAAVLGGDERAALVGAMLTDVLGAVTGAGVDRVVVLAAGDAAAGAARALGVDVLRDPPVGGIDPAISAAAGRLHAGSSLVVPADLALLGAADVEALLREPGDVVVAPTADGGTGGLLRRPAWVIDTSYGPSSAARHLLAARRAGLRATRVELPGFALDVDEPSDLSTALLSDRVGPATARVLGAVDDVTARLDAFLASSA